MCGDCEYFTFWPILRLVTFTWDLTEFYFKIYFFFGILKVRALFKMHKVCSFLQGPLMARKNRQTRAQLQNSSYRAIQSRTRSVNTVRVVYWAPVCGGGALPRWHSIAQHSPFSNFFTGLRAVLANGQCSRASKTTAVFTSRADGPWTRRHFGHPRLQGSVYTDS